MADDSIDRLRNPFRFGRRVGDYLLSLRDTLLTDPRFQRWASRFPLTKPVARRQAAAAFDLCAGFVYSQVLLACVQLHILDRVRPGPLSLDALAKQLPLPLERARLLINSAVALGLLSRRAGERVGLGMLGAAIVANPGISAMIEHHALAYTDFADPVALLAGDKRETRLSNFWSYASGHTACTDPARAVAYSALMTRSQPMLAEDILESYPFDQHTSILDIGGGEGEFLLAMARRYARPSVHLFDLPPVAGLAAARFDDAELGDRASVIPGDFFADPLPKGHDAITLVRIAHDHDDDKVLALFASIRRAIAPGGTLVIAEPMSGDPDSARIADVYFAFYLLAMGSGRPRSAQAITRMLRASGFADIRPIRTPRPMLVSMIAARAK